MFPVYGGILKRYYSANDPDVCQGSIVQNQCDRTHLLLCLGSAVAWWLMSRTPDSEVESSNHTWVKPCCVLEQGIFTPQKYR